VNDNLETTNDLITLFNLYHKGIYNYMYFQVKFRVDIAEDLTQDVFLRAWEKRQLFDQSKGSIKNWLYAIARNILMDFLRANKIVNADEEFWKSQVSTGIQTDEVDKFYIYKALALLSEEEKELIILRYIQGYEIDELCEIFNWSYSNTKVKIHRAFTKLKQKVNHL
jgi:RNA polymerase sigma-70 factor (ECF subfamily)